MSIEGIDWEDGNPDAIRPSLEEQRKAALAQAGEALGVVAGMLPDEEVSVPDVIQQAVNLTADNDRRLRELAQRYRCGIDPATLVGMRVAALCDALIGLDGTEARASFELMLGHNYANLITQVESQARINALTQGLGGMNGNGRG